MLSEQTEVNQTPIKVLQNAKIFLFKQFILNNPGAKNKINFN